MASALLQSTDYVNPINAGAPHIVKAGARLWTCAGGGTDATNPGCCLWYSDDDGASWTKHSQMTSSSATIGTLFAYDDAGTWRLHIILTFGAAASTSGSLRIRSIHSNVASGVPGAATTTVNIDAGGTNAGVIAPNIFVTQTATNPRVWIVARKATAASTFETRVWYCAIGTAPDTAANWTAIANAGGNSGADTFKTGAGVWWTIAGAHRATIVCQDGQAAVDQFKAFTFDPAAASPALGAATTFAALASGSFAGTTEQPLFTIAARADYLVFARHDPQSSNNWTVYKTVNGTAWTTPTGWSGLTMGRAALTTDGTDFWMVHTASYGVVATTAQALNYRKITASTDAMGAASAFSDTNGNQVACTVAGGVLYSVYRAGTASPYSVRTDSVSVATGGASLSPAGIASAEAFGSSAVTRGGVTTSPSAIASAEAWGSSTVSPGGVNAAPAGIPTAEAFGSSTVMAGGLSLAPAGIATAEAFGAGTVTRGAVNVTAAAIASAEAFGSLTLVATLAVTPAGIASGEAWGSSTATRGPVAVLAPGIASAEAWGAVAVIRAGAGVGTIRATGPGAIAGAGVGTISATSPGVIGAP